MSLKWRIALGYSLLLIVAMTLMSGIIVWRFQQILYDQATASVNATMRKASMPSRSAMVKPCHIVDPSRSRPLTSGPDWEDYLN